MVRVVEILMFLALGDFRINSFGIFVQTHSVLRFRIFVTLAASPAFQELFAILIIEILTIQ